MKSIEVFYETRATVNSIKFANAESYFNVSKPMSYLAKQKIRCILKTIWKTLNKKAYIFSLKILYIFELLNTNLWSMFLQLSPCHVFILLPGQFTVSGDHEEICYDRGALSSFQNCSQLPFPVEY